MPASFDNSGKPAYMYDEVGDTWYAFGAKIDTASAYEWTNTQTYLNDVTFDDAVIFRDGFNNFLNPAARDAAITSPVQGTIVFLRQDAGGNTINQIQYYSGSAWTANDGDISQITAGTGLSGGGTAGNVTVSIDTAVVATTNNTLTMTNKTLALGSNTISGTLAEFNTALTDGDFASLAGSETLTNKTLTTPTITTPTLTLSSTSSTTSGRVSFDSSTDKIIVGDGTNAVEFAPSTILTNAQTASYGLVLADKDKLVEMNVASGNNLTVPLNSSHAFPIGSQITILQTGAGQTTVVATGGVTINATPGLKLRARWSSATLIKRGTDTWVLVGDLSA